MTPAEILAVARNRILVDMNGLRITPYVVLDPEAMGNALNMQCDSHRDYLTALFALRHALGINPRETIYSFWRGVPEDARTIGAALGFFNQAIAAAEAQEQANAHL